MFIAYSVRNLKSPKTGRPVPNQFVVSRQYCDDSAPIRELFISYETHIAIADHRAKTVKVSRKKYSRTTSKYTAQFLSQFKNYTVEYMDEDEV